MGAAAVAVAVALTDTPAQRRNNMAAIPVLPQLLDGDAPNQQQQFPLPVELVAWRPLSLVDRPLLLLGCQRWRAALVAPALLGEAVIIRFVVHATDNAEGGTGWDHCASVIRPVRLGTMHLFGRFRR
jgi:hypothetical protein